jgi:ABC-2 type transport system ATP-binding protein
MIDIANLSFKYGRKSLFSDLNLTLAGGGICGLLGKNGSGKTTLLKLMAGLRFPRDGKIEAYGQAPAGRSTTFLQDLFFLPELFELPVVTPLQYEKLFSPFYPAFQKELFKNFLQEFEIPVDEKMNGISYGQKKKFMLAFGLAAGCRLTLLDEPTNGLDITSKSSFRKAVASCFTDDRVFVIATHQVRDLESLIDPVVILDEGKIIFNESQETISSRLKVTYHSEEPVSDETLYLEKRMGRYLTVSENHDGTFSDIDLETLFNSVVGNRDRISRIFQEGEGK